MNHKKSHSTLTGIYLFLVIFVLTSVNAVTSYCRNTGNFPSPGPGETGSHNTEIQLSPHPRLFFPAGSEREILGRAEKNPLLSDLIIVLQKEADIKLELPLQKYISDGKMLHVSREQISRMLVLSMAYRLSGKERYAAKVEEELLNVCGFVSWNPSHFLDVAEMTTAVAIGYDWCYGFLRPETRETVEKAILGKAFAPAWPIYEKEGKTPFSRENNWNMVCNSGMVNGALAIGDKYPQQLEQIIQYAVRYTPNLLKAFAPEGVFNEGPGYWSYNGMYMALLFDNLTRIAGNDYGLPAFEGLDHTAGYYIAQVGASGKDFNYGDASEGTDASGTFFFLSRYYHQPEVAAYYRDLLQSVLDKYKTGAEVDFPRFFFLAIPWFDESKVTAKVKDGKLTVFQGVTDLLIFNGNSTTDGNRIYLAAKTGRADWSHNQLDAGSFVLDCGGERWGIDMGADNYNLPDFWDYKPGGTRWNYFRNTNMAHNTLSIDGKPAFSSGQGEIIRFSKESDTPWGIFDLSPSYPEQVSSVQRGFRLLSSHSLLVRDEILPKKEGELVSWRFLTRANVKIDGNTAILSQNGKNFYIKCLSPLHPVMKMFPAKPFSPQEKPIHGVNIIEITQALTGTMCEFSVVLSNDLNDPEIRGPVTFPLKGWE